jgi:hypothetical protein
MDPIQREQQGFDEFKNTAPPNIVDVSSHTPVAESKNKKPEDGYEETKGGNKKSRKNSKSKKVRKMKKIRKSKKIKNSKRKSRSKK